jgi:transposase
MKKWEVILGVDVSKLTLDISCAEQHLHLRISNDSKGFAVFKKWCREYKFELENTLVVMEHTGGYEYRFMQFCSSLGLSYCRLAGLEIKQSMGIQRGKNDQADSYRIATYGQEKIRRLKPSEPVNQQIMELKQLLAFRKRLVREKAGLQATLKERAHMYGHRKGDTITVLSRQKMKDAQKYIAKVEAEISELIASDGQLLQNYKILTSIKGVGPVNAWMTLAYTANFTLFSDARKYAVYIGVVPFSHSSGTSIRGRARVSHIANKELKQELNQAAKAAITHDKDIGEYAARKRLTKSYALVLNNVKFKLILRMFSLIKRQELYVDNYRKAA